MINENEINVSLRTYNISRKQYEQEIEELKKRCEILSNALLQMSIGNKGNTADIRIPKADFIKIYNAAVNDMFDHPDEDNDIYGYDVTVHWHGFYCNCGDGAIPSNHIIGGLECLYDEEPEEW